MMPVTLATEGQPLMVRKISGNKRVVSFLENLGLVPGSEVTLVSKNPSGVILNVRESRIALGEDMARRILI